ncbi:hypothetical protein HK405_014189, partial [Cladochytrium tenue]
RALDIIFILHAEHELSCSTAAVRQLASTGVDPFTCVAAGTAALYGPFHGGANEAALRMLEEIGTVENVPAFIEQVKAKKRRLMGFGHRLLRKAAEQVFALMGHSPLADVAFEIERIALSDDYFIKRRLFPNVDFYSGVVYKAMGFPTDFFPVLFAIPLVAGWLAHWREQLTLTDAPADDDDAAVAADTRPLATPTLTEPAPAWPGTATPPPPQQPPGCAPSNRSSSPPPTETWPSFRAAVASDGPAPRGYLNLEERAAAAAAEEADGAALWGRSLSPRRRHLAAAGAVDDADHGRRRRRSLAAAAAATAAAKAAR